MTDSEREFPGLIERTLRLLTKHGEPIAESAIIAELFGATSGPWSRFLTGALANEPRMTRLEDGRWALAGSKIGISLPRVESSLHESPATYLTNASAFNELDASEASHDHRPYVGLVVVASGPKPWRHPIIAVGAARYRHDGQVEHFEMSVQPERRLRIPAYLARLGITEESLEDASSLAHMLDAFDAFCGDATLVGVDVALAVAHLQFARRSLEQPPLTNSMIELAIANDQRPDLERLARARGLAYPVRPRPASLAALALALADQQPGTGPQSHTEPSTQGDSQPIGAVSALRATDGRVLLDDEQLADVPFEPGIYIFRGGDDRVLYVGKATSLRQRLASYLTGNFRIARAMSGLVDQTNHLDWEVHVSEFAARVRETEMIATHCPAYNVQRGPLVLTVAELGLVPTAIPDSAVVLRLSIDSAPLDTVSLDSTSPWVITTRLAAREALSEARRSWWPSRPRRAERPSRAMIADRLERLREVFRTSCRAAPLGSDLNCADLDLVLVVAPLNQRARQPISSPPVRRDDDDRWWLDEVGERTTVNEKDSAGMSRERSWSSSVQDLSDDTMEPFVAFTVGPGGMGVSAPIGHLAFDTLPDLMRAAALRAIGSISRESCQPTNGGVAALNAIVRAYQRGEQGLRIFPMKVDHRGSAEMARLFDATSQSQLGLTESELF